MPILERFYRSVWQLKQKDFTSLEVVMVTPLDAVCLQMIQAERKPVEVHYHLANPPLAHPRPMMDEANFQLVSRHITHDQIGFDYYDNVVTYRV